MYDEDVEDLVQQRAHFIRKIRLLEKVLAYEGVVLEETESGTTWRRLDDKQSS